MSLKVAQKRLTREYQTIADKLPPSITAHPSEKNILEWHYIIGGPKDTPYADGQYWGVLTFPDNYPFSGPTVVMKTPSGRFEPSKRICMSISDFHPKGFNPTWEVSTILIGLQSFMAGNEATTGGVYASNAERKLLADRSRWWNSTAGGSHLDKTSSSSKAGDGGKRFREEWPEVDKANWEWMASNDVDTATGRRAGADKNSCAKTSLGIGGSSGHNVVDAVVQQRDAGRGWMSRHKYLIAGALLFTYVLIARLINGDSLA
ncbi:actin family protein [Emericellopsis cladophorae]|uniref:Actin family protein n=1 Tax=Emericellopsis cladophorae TaxID=2686198 RepID=A0A9P9Y7K6_9HYPO|nr:actin family protein [Emericellopsis cladophorae]KAI6784538.1 actin family protein [Emericellopsis cladophorae]